MESGSGLDTTGTRTHAMSRQTKSYECLQRPGSETLILILVPKPKNNPSPEHSVSQSLHQLRSRLISSPSPALFACLHHLSLLAYTLRRQDQMLGFSGSKLEKLLDKCSPSFNTGQHIFLENCNFGSSAAGSRVLPLRRLSVDSPQSYPEAAWD